MFPSQVVGDQKAIFAVNQDSLLGPRVFQYVNSSRTKPDLHIMSFFTVTLGSDLLSALHRVDHLGCMCLGPGGTGLIHPEFT